MPLTAAERAQLQRGLQVSTEGPDRILGLFGDLNAPLRALAPEEVPPDPYSSTPYAGGGVEVWDPRQDPGPAMGDGPADPDQNPALRQSLDRMAALDRNAYRNIASVPFEAAKVVNSPYDALEHLGTAFMGLIKKATGPAISRAAGITPDDPDIQAAETMGRGLAHQFTKEGREQRPLDPLLTVGGLAVPALRARGALPAASAGGRTAQLARILEDPGMEALAALFRGSKTAAGKVREALPDMPKPIRALREKISEKVSPEQVQHGAQTVSDEFLGFSTSTGPTVQRIIRQAPEKGTSRIVKEFSGDFEDPALAALPGPERRAIAQKRLLVNAAEGVDRIQKSVNDFQDQAKEALAPHMRDGLREGSLEALKKEASAVIRNEFNARIKDEFAIEILEPQIHQIPSQRSTTPSAMFRGALDQELAEFPEATRIRPGETPKDPTQVRGRTGEAEISFPDFPHPRPTQVSSRGAGREMLKDFYGRLINSKPTTVGALQRFMWEIDAAIKVTDNEIGKHANRALNTLRAKIRKTLSDEFGGPSDEGMNLYDEATWQYEQDMTALSNLKIELGLEPGMLDSQGGLGPINRQGTLNQLMRSMDVADELAYETLLELETRGQVTDIQEQMAGAATQRWMGTGLVQKSEAAQAGRQAGRMMVNVPKQALSKGGLVGAAWLFYGPVATGASIAASSVFSPKLMQRAMLDVAPKVRPKYQAALRQARLAMEKGSQAGLPVSEWIKGGARIEQVLQRLEAADERSDTPRNPRPNATLQALGGMIIPPF